MLQTQTVKPTLLELLISLMSSDLFNNFQLVGGTALALQIGHRQSTDIDLFGASAIDEIEFTAILNEIGTPIVLKKSKHILIYNVNGIKLDFVDYSYPWIAKGKVEKKIRFASFEDIAAMKLNAIAGRGSKKDFIDLFFLLNHFSLKEMLTFYSKKYHDGSIFMVLKSLSYFSDADSQEMPLMFDNTPWLEMKNKIKDEVLRIS